MGAINDADLVHWMTLGDLSRDHRRSHPWATAVICGENRHTYRDLDDRVNRLANGLRSLDVSEGDRILWLGQNCHRVLEGILAAAKLGAVFCPANWRWEVPELVALLDDVGPKVVLWQEEAIGEKVRHTREQTGSSGVWIQHDGNGVGSYEALLASASTDDQEPVINPASGVVQLYTAAWGGRQNGALLSHMNVIVHDLVTAINEDLDHSCVYLNAGPLFHIATLWHTLAVFHMAGTNVFIRQADAELICQTIQRERCTRSFIIEPTISRIVELNYDGRYDLKSLEVSPKSKPEWLAMVTPGSGKWANRVGGYGQTEVSGMLTVTAALAEGLHGRPVPSTQVRLLDETGTEVPDGEIGELASRGLTTMIGYHDRPELNAERFKGGWYRTADLGRREPDGSITFVGPKGRLVKSGVENIYPLEVERTLARHPAVAEAAIIGIPDATWGQSVKAIVVLKPDHAAKAEEIIDFCRQNLASYKKPRAVEFIASIPRKGLAIDYDALDEQFGGGGYPGSKLYRQNTGA